MSGPDYEYPFDPTAVNNTAASVYRMAASGGQRVLDLGSGPGIVSAHLQRNDAREVACLDNSASALEAAALRGVSRTVQADLADPGWISEFAGESFDVVILADVLEHLVRPEELLTQIAESELLAQEGFLVISFPNAGHEAVVAELLAGRFTYQDTGLLDATHLRFFTLTSMQELLERCGLFITRIERTKRTAEQTSLADSATAMEPKLRRRLIDTVPDMQTFQFVVRAEPAHAAKELTGLRQELRQLHAARDAAADQVDLAPRLAELEKLVAAQEDEIVTLRADLETKSTRLVEAESALKRERLLTDMERQGREQALHQLAAARKSPPKQVKDKQAHKEIARLERELDHVYRSRTWRVGKAVWSIFHGPKTLIRRLVARDSASPQTTDTIVAAATPQEPRLPQPPPSLEYTLIENTVMRQRYQDVLNRKTFSDPASSRNMVMTVYTDDLDAGRGDVYVAIGLGRYLERIGYEVIYLPQDKWYELPEGTSIYVSMLDWVEVARIPASITRIAWIRNRTAAWSATPWLPLYDMVFASSEETRAALRRCYPGPIALLPLAVDAELFAMKESGVRAGVVTTQNNWGTERIAHQLLATGGVSFPLAIYGQDRGIDSRLKHYVRGPVSFFSLASLYNQAAVVVDDLLVQNAPYGNTNSRLFEALACGASVVTNQTLGLETLGLEPVPSYQSASELVELIRDRLAPISFGGDLKQLRQTILDRHTYAHRASEVAGQLTALDSGRHRKRADHSLIGFYPDYRDNPYQEMMWSGMRRDNAIPFPLGDDFDAAPLLRADGSRRVFHLNWTAPILGQAPNDAVRLTRYRQFIGMLDTLRQHNIPSIWTIHNVLPHECADTDMEARLRQEIADRVDLVHVMCEATASAVSEHYEIPASKIRVLPHPSYIDVYPNLIDQETARFDLGILPDEFVYVFLGKIRHYKGVDLLLDAFERIHRDQPGARLLIAGEPGRFPGRPEIEQRAKAHPAILANFHSVGDSDIQLYMNAADAVVLPYRSGLNSGAMMLAYSFARPVIVADSGCISNHVDATTGVSFRWEDGDSALYQAMREGEKLRADEFRRAAYRRAAELHYLTISKGFCQLVDEAWSMVE